MAHVARETWLLEAAEGLRPLFVEVGNPVTGPIRVAMSFPSSRALSATKPRIGECWSALASADGTSEIMISPRLDDPLMIVATLAHEIGHAVLGGEVGHKAPFARLMKALGLDGKPTATFAGERFKVFAEPLLTSLGPIPHARLNGRGPIRKQTTRLIKCECTACGYLARVTRKWLDDVGAPVCPTDHVQMVAD